MNGIRKATEPLAGTVRHRRAERQTLGIAGRLVWKDAKGSTRFNTVRIQNISETGAYVETLSGSPIPMYRLVSLLAERRDDAALPLALRQGRILSAVYRVGPSTSSGLPEGYGLRLLVEPRRPAPAAAQYVAERILEEATA